MYSVRGQRSRQAGTDADRRQRPFGGPLTPEFQCQGRVKPRCLFLVLLAAPGRRGSSRFDNRHAATVLKISLTLWEQDFNPAGTCVTRLRRRNPCKI
jgi:hypothetical protein